MTSGSRPCSRTALLRMLVALVTAAALAGCGGGDGAGKGSNGSATTTTATATATATASPTAHRGEDERIAKAAQLELDDFPSGWEESDEGPSQGADCDAISRARKERTARAESPRFRHGDNTLAQSTVYLFANDAKAGEQFAGLTSKDTRACIAEDLGSRLEKANPDLKVGEPETSRIAVDPLGDQHEGGRVSLPVTTQGQEVELFTDFVFVRVSRGIALMLFVDALTPFDEDMRADLTSKVSRRLAAQLG